MHGRHAHVDGDLLVDDVLGRGGRIETRMENKLRAQAKSEQHDDGQRIDMEQRQDAEKALLAHAQRVRAAAGHDLHIERARRGEIGVGQHRALGRAGRAAGICNDGQRLLDVAERMGGVAPVIVDQVAEGEAAVVVLDLGQHSGGRHLRLDRSGSGRHLGEFADDERLEAGGSQELLGLRIERGEVEADEDIGLAVFDLVLKRVQRIERRVIDHRAAGLEHAEEGDDVVGRVGQEEPNVDARADAELLEPEGGAVRQRLQFTHKWSACP